MLTICIICAIPQETRPILRRFCASAKSVQHDLPAWQFQHAGNTVILIQSGIGVKNAAMAATAALDLNPDLIISAGFCGALSPAAAPGELFIAERLCCYTAGALSNAIEPDPALLKQIGSGLRKGTFITATEIAEKALLTPQLTGLPGANLVEMESSSIAAACLHQGVAFIAIRSVSDTVEYDPAPLFRKICDKRINVSIIKIVLSLIKRPALLYELMKLSRDSKIAGESLAAGIETALERI